MDTDFGEQSKKKPVSTKHWSEHEVEEELKKFDAKIAEIKET